MIKSLCAVNMQYITCFLVLGGVTLVLGQNAINSSYEASDLVRHTHQWPHWNRHLKPVDADFAITTDSSWNSYTESVVVFPSIIGASFLVAVVIFQISLLFRCCFDCCTCHPKHRRASTDQSQSTMRLYNSIRSSRRRYMCSFFLVLCIILVADQGIFPSKYHMNHAVKSAKDSIDFFHDTFLVLEDTGYELESSGDVIYSKVNRSTASCNEASNMLPYIESYEEYVDTYIDYVEPIPDNAKNLKHTVYEYGIITLNQVVYSFYAGILLIVSLYTIAYFCRSEGGMKVTIGLSEIVVLGLIITVCTQMIILMMMADFCMKPTDNALSIAPDESIDVITYYATCNGTNPLEDPLTDAYATVVLLNESISTLTQPGGACEGNPYLIACYEDIDDILGNLTMIEDTAACPPIQDEWANIFNDAVCDSGFYGLFSFWTVQLACMTFLFVLMIVACFVYNYFGTYGDVSPNDLHRQEQRRRLLDHRVAAPYDAGAPGEPVVATAVASAPPLTSEPFYVSSANVTVAPYHSMEP